MTEDFEKSIEKMMAWDGFIEITGETFNTKFLMTKAHFLETRQIPIPKEYTECAYVVTREHGKPKFYFAIQEALTKEKVLAVFWKTIFGEHYHFFTLNEFHRHFGKHYRDRNHEKEAVAVKKVFEQSVQGIESDKAISEISKEYIGDYFKFAPAIAHA